MVRLCNVCLILAIMAIRSSANPRLEQYKVKKNGVSVSGISAGGAMAVQYHVAMSSRVMGLGVMAGIPYGCVGVYGVFTCMRQPELITAATLISVADTASALGTIDSTSHMENDRVFIYHSKQDTVVMFGVSEKIDEFYQHFITSNVNVQTEFNISSQHGVPTLNYGSVCSEMGSEYIMNCSYSAAFHILNHIYGGQLQEPTSSTSQNGQVKTFNQSEFFDPGTPGAYSMDTVGYVYIPSGCATKSHSKPVPQKCKLHIVFHGCLQGRELIGEAFVRHTGYNEVGELNNIIMLYPQVTSSALNPMVAGTGGDIQVFPTEPQVAFR